jgi:hypothetical protein
MQGLVGGVAIGSAAEREQWTVDLIPRSQAGGTPCTGPEEDTESRACAWGCGDVRQARAEMRQAGKTPSRAPTIPWVRLARLTAPGPSGDRQEHLDDIIEGAGADSGGD